MANTVARKTFKLELEMTVEMQEVGEEHLPGPDQTGQLAHLKRLQTALLHNEPALTEQMLAAVVDKLQEYMDYLVAQDDLALLEKVADGLDREDRRYFETGLEGSAGDFAGLTRPLRRSSLVVRLDSSAIHAKQEQACDDMAWQPVWQDLMPQAELARRLEQLAHASPQVYGVPRLSGVHHLMLRFLTRQQDGIHFEGLCTCERSLEGIGETEDQALEALWVSFSDHYEASAFEARGRMDSSLPGERNISTG